MRLKGPPKEETAKGKTEQQALTFLVTLPHPASPLVPSTASATSPSHTHFSWPLLAAGDQYDFQANLMQGLNFTRAKMLGVLR